MQVAEALVAAGAAKASAKPGLGFGKVDNLTGKYRDLPGFSDQLDESNVRRLNNVTTSSTRFTGNNLLASVPVPHFKTVEEARVVLRREFARLEKCHGKAAVWGPSAAAVSARELDGHVRAMASFFVQPGAEEYNLVVSAPPLSSTRLPEVVRVPELRGRPVPGRGPPRAAVLASATRGGAGGLTHGSAKINNVDDSRGLREAGHPWTQLSRADLEHIVDIAVRKATRAGRAFINAEDLLGACDDRSAAFKADVIEYMRSKDSRLVLSRALPQHHGIHIFKRGGPPICGMRPCDHW